MPGPFPKARIHRLGDLQLRIMKVLWARHQATVADVLQTLGPASPLAYTTVATMLRKMETRGLVRHDTEGRTFVYQAAVPENVVHRSMTDHLVDRLFRGSLPEVVQHLLTTREVSAAELDQLERLIAERREEQGRRREGGGAPAAGNRPAGKRLPATDPS